ncbi:MAG: tungsten ABC transporter substrate-binding protein [Actinobacteria bacterium]|nr:MAG: tungsten ABC transporter substrate-binding protein [Actinomycetota bacterium]
MKEETRVESKVRGRFRIGVPVPAVILLPALVVTLVSALVVSGCALLKGKGGSTGTAGSKQEKSQLILATTTSTEDTGLLDELIPAFNEKYPEYQVKTVAVGSGEAMAMGKRGDADVLLVHSKDDEEKFMAEGFGSSREAVMHNDFVIVGPEADPAGARRILRRRLPVGASVSAITLSAVARGKIVFVSRAEGSGTHKKELKLWKRAGIEPEGSWYVETGQGMGETLRVADEKGGYTLTDRGTWLAMKDSLKNLRLLIEGDMDLLNNYHIIVVSKAKFPKINEAGAKAFSDYITSVEGQRLIKGFGVEKYAEPLFFPDAAK